MFRSVTLVLCGISGTLWIVIMSVVNHGITLCTAKETFINMNAIIGTIVVILMSVLKIRQSVKESAMNMDFPLRNIGNIVDCKLIKNN